MADTSRVLLVEDDHVSAAAVRSEFKLNFLDTLSLWCMGSEYEFTSQFEEIRRCTPLAVLLDLRVRWCRPDDVLESAEYQREPGGAGARMWARLASDLGTCRVPVLVYSTSDEATVRAALRANCPAGLQGTWRGVPVVGQREPRKVVELLRSVAVADRVLAPFVRDKTGAPSTSQIKTSLAAAQALLHNALGAAEEQAFVVMKLGDPGLESAYHGVIKPLIEEHGMRCVRIDEVQDGGKITDELLDAIVVSRMVLCDLSGERPNCYYEAGWAHALGKEVVFSIRKGERIHFDLAGHRFIQWETEHDFRSQLRERLNAIVARSRMTG